MPFLAHFGLKERSFGLTPNSGLYYPSAAHQEVLGSLAYAVERGEGVVKVSGEVGTGKTLLCRMVTAGLVETAAVAYIINPQANADWVIGAVCREFGLDPDSTSDPLHMLNGFLLEQFAAKRQVLVVVDEAQALGIVGLETVRRLSNLETDKTKLLQIVLFGQPELDRLLADRALRQLNQRIVFSFTIPALGAEDTADYIHHRVRTVSENGAAGPSLFDDRAVKAIARASQGIPRVTNIIADKSLLAAFGQGAHKVTAQHVSDAVKDSRLVIESLPDRDSGGWGQRALNALNRRAADNAPPPPATTQPSMAVRPDITLGEAAEEWLAACQDRGLKPTTLSDRQRHVETYVRPKLGADQAANITADTIGGLAREWTQALPAGDAVRVLASLNSIFVEAVRRHHIMANPARGIRIERPAKTAKPLAIPSAAEMRTLLDTAKPDLAALISSAALTGLRAAELRALTWDNVDLTAGLIHVRRMAVGRDGIVAANPLAARRSIALSSQVVNRLGIWRTASEPGPMNLVFPGKDGAMLSSAMLQRGPFARLQKKCAMTDGGGKPLYRFDDLRHGAAALFIEQGWTARRLRDTLGEASIATTARRYSALFDRAGDDRVAMNLIAERLLGSD
ncbi:MAG: AAA family ATPase [Alphaproteobacteria bacterium]